MIAGAGLAVGAPWQVAERGFDRTAPGDGAEGKDDTAMDIVVDTPARPSPAASPAAPGTP